MFGLQEIKPVLLSEAMIIIFIVLILKPGNLSGKLKLRIMLTEHLHY